MLRWLSSGFGKWTRIVIFWRWERHFVDINSCEWTIFGTKNVGGSFLICGHSDINFEWFLGESIKDAIRISHDASKHVSLKRERWFARTVLEAADTPDNQMYKVVRSLLIFMYRTLSLPLHLSLFVECALLWCKLVAFMQDQWCTELLEDELAGTEQTHFLTWRGGGRWDILWSSVDIRRFVVRTDSANPRTFLKIWKIRCSNASRFV